MFAPVVTRFRTYGVDLSRFGDDGSGAVYMDVIFVLPARALDSTADQASAPDRRCSAGADG